MKLFECQKCGQPLYFDNTRCESCGLALGYLPGRDTVVALVPRGDALMALAEPDGRYRYCANNQHDVCNWLIRFDAPAVFCAACRHNRTIPDLAPPGNVARWRKIEAAKHRLFYTLLKLRLPLTTRTEDPERGLAFDFIAEDPATRATTGHAAGVITVNLAEADDAERERRRFEMGEPYRTLLGHFRHEIAHYYWARLVAPTARLQEFRALFGAERQDYAASLERHYSGGAAPDWPQHYLTRYASVHPWEDFAETWAHFFHMMDTLETVAAFGLSVKPEVGKGAGLAAIDFDPHRAELDRIVAAWLPLTFAVNSINRSMGLPDLYPFVLSQVVIGKLG